MRAMIHRLSALLAIFIALGASTTQANSGYTLIDLGTLGGGDSHAYGINDRGQVVGDSITATGERHAFLWQNGLITDLGTLGGAWSYARAINDSGQIVGLSATATGQSRAFLWEKGHMIDLGTLTGVGGSGAQGINNRGQIVGWSSTATDTGHAFLWEKGRMIDLDAFADSSSAANAINDNGQVVGSLWRPTQDLNLAFLWKDGVMSTLALLPGDSEGIASSINDRNQVVGGSIGTFPRAFVWSAGHAIALTTEQSWPNDINDRGQVVGRWVPSAESGITHVAVWYKGQRTLLPVPGDKYAEGMSINNHAQVAGWVLNNGQIHAVVWTPTR